MKPSYWRAQRVKKFPIDFVRWSIRHATKTHIRENSNEMVAICASIQRASGSIVCTANCARPFQGELAGIFSESIAPVTFALMDSLRSCNVYKDLGTCSVVEITKEDDGFYNLNTMVVLRSYIKGMCDHYRGMMIKYINRYNAMFLPVFRSNQELSAKQFSNLCNTNTYWYWHIVRNAKEFNLTRVWLNHHPQS